MPLPKALQSLVTVRRFWTDFLFNTSADEDAYAGLGETIRLLFPVSADAKVPCLSLEFDSDLSSFELELQVGSESHTLGWDDQAHWHPHVLRWEELDLICRAVARLDPELPHPGLPLLFLQRFTPICGQRGGDDDDADLAITLLDAAWRRLGLFSSREIQALVERQDARDAGFRWHRADSATGTWVLRQEEGRSSDGGQTLQRELYTLRGGEDSEEEPENGSDEGGNFPHEHLAVMLDTARKTVLATSNGETVPDGILPSERPPRPAYELRVKHSLDLRLPLRDPVRPLSIEVSASVIHSLNRILSDLDLGHAVFSGSGSQLVDGQFVPTDTSVSIQIDGDRDRGIQIIRETLQWAGAPESTALRANHAYQIALNLDLEGRRSGEVHFQLATFRPRASDAEPLREFEIMLPNACADSLHGDTDVAIRGPDDDSWLVISATDGGEMGVRFASTEVDPDRKAGSLSIRSLSPVLAGFLYRYLASQSLGLFPPGLVASEVPSGIETKTYRADSEARLYDILASGPYAWWSTQTSSA